MRIIGPDELHFGVDDMEACRGFLTDFGLTESEPGVFEAKDGTCFVIKDMADADLPPALPTGNKLRRTVYGVEDTASLDEIAAELSRDREVTRGENGSVEAVDDLGFALRFQITRRHAFEVEPELVNTPGVAAGRPANKHGINLEAETLPLTLSHVVYFVPDIPKMEAFYVERLKFRVVDRFKGMGPFLTPLASTDHHTLFLIQTPEYMKGIEHAAFHMQGPTSLMLAGNKMRNKGYETFWGPGRHQFGSNWFWYFKSPMGCAVEYDADMDRLDEAWLPRELPASAEVAQAFLLQAIDKWAPGGPPPEAE
ncbi:VOC family protein (plasmid) [Shimia sp. W99]|jgi:catechol 2,3-dioxygenase-like lactoylglutathione lyase family enzyme